MNLHIVDAMPASDRAELIQEARYWLADCGLSTVGMSNKEVLAAVHRNSDGGLVDFIVRCGL